MIGRRLAPLAALLGVLLAGCGPLFLDIPADLRTPSVAGVVEEITRLAGGRDVYRLRNGQRVEVDYDRTSNLLGGPAVGWLLLAGTDPEGRQWIAGVSPSGSSNEPGCYRLPSAGRDAGAWIETTGGFRLPKAPDFAPRSSYWVGRTEFTSSQGYFCLNEQGEVTSYEG